MTPNSTFDRWLEGDDNALSAEQREGYQLFKSRGCISCHQGTNVGGNLVEKFGAMNERPKDGPLTEADRGRATITKAEGDRLAAENLAAAAATMLTSPGAMQLRTLQTLDGLGPTASNTVVLAIPVEVLQLASRFADKK